MIAYILLTLSPLVISYFYPKLNTDNKVKKRYLIVCGAILVLFIGLRSKYLGSPDSLNYYGHMQRALLSTSWDLYYNPSGVETGFQLFVYILSKFFNSAQMLFVVTAAIYISSNFYCIYKNSDNIVLSIVMYITLGLMQFQMQGMRQAIAMSICLFSFELAKKKKFIPFVLLVVLATFFHRTAIVFVLTYIVTFLPYNLWILAAISICSVLAFAFSDVIVGIANTLFDAEYTQIIDSGGLVATAIYVIIIVLAMIFHRQALHKKSDKTQTVIFYVTIIAFISYMMRYFGVGIAERISFYFMFGQVLLLPNTISNISPDYKKATTIGVYVMCLLLFIYRLNGSDLIPYRFFWN